MPLNKGTKPNKTYNFSIFNVLGKKNVFTLDIVSSVFDNIYIKVTLVIKTELDTQR